MAENQTSRSDFILLGLFHCNQVPWVLFAVLMLTFLMALFGNTTIIMLVGADCHLHNPMYFPLSQLSLMDLLYVSMFIPKMVLNFLSGNYHISFIGCGAQVFLFMTLVAAECLMAYDCYVAICHPLHYPILMCPATCVLMVVGSWLSTLLNALIHVVYIMTLPNCASREIHHSFCVITALLKLVCTDTSQYEKGLHVSSVIFLPPILAIIASYGRILMTVLGIGSSLGVRKTLATCFSHLTMVCLSYGAAIIKYLLPKSYHSPGQDKVVLVFSTILMLIFNPLIYSLRSKVIARVLRKVFKK